MNSYTSVPLGFPRCGACIYWSGEKRVCGDIIQYDIYSCAICNNFESPAYGQEVSADHYCFMKKDFE